MATPSSLLRRRAASVPATRAERARLAAAAVVAVAALALIGLAGWAAGGAIRGTPAAPPHLAVRTASVGPMDLALDDGWTRATADRHLAGAALPSVQAFVVTPGLPARAWLATARVENRALLPRTLLRQVAGALPAPGRTRLAGRPAWTYSAIALRSGAHLDVTVAPTRRMVLLVGCEAAPAWWPTAAGCSRGVHAITGPAAVRPATDLAYREHAGRVLRALRARRVAAAHTLRHARTARRQAVGADRLAAAHRRAARALAPVGAMTGPTHAVVHALRRAARAYAGLARAARHRRRGSYRHRRIRAERADAALRHALLRAR